MTMIFELILMWVLIIITTWAFFQAMKATVKLAMLEVLRDTIEIRTMIVKLGLIRYMREDIIKPKKKTKKKSKRRTRRRK